MVDLFWDASGLVKRYALELGTDRRVLRAAQAEGLLTINPETVSVDEALAMVSDLS